MIYYSCRYIRLYKVMIMYIEKNKNNGIDYLRLVKSQRIVNSKGIKTSTKSVVYNIGPLSRFDDGKPDYVERLKQSFKQGNLLSLNCNVSAQIPFQKNTMIFILKKAIPIVSVIRSYFPRYLSKEYLKNWG